MFSLLMLHLLFHLSIGLNLLLSIASFHYTSCSILVLIAGCLPFAPVCLLVPGSIPCRAAARTGTPSCTRISRHLSATAGMQLCTV